MRGATCRQRCMLTNYLSSRPREGLQRGPLAAACYTFCSSCTLCTSPMLLVRLSVISYVKLIAFYLEKFMIEIIYGLRYRLLYSLNRNFKILCRSVPLRFPQSPRYLTKDWNLDFCNNGGTFSGIKQSPCPGPLGRYFSVTSAWIFRHDISSWCDSYSILLLAVYPRAKVRAAN